jgi:hypothetical protein
MGVQMNVASLLQHEEEYVCSTLRFDSHVFQQQQQKPQKKKETFWIRSVKMKMCIGKDS